VDGSPPPSACLVGPAPSSLNLDPFYAKHCDVRGIPLISSSLVPDAAFLAAADVVGHMATARDEVRQALIARGAYVGIMARTEVTTDIPEHAFLAEDTQTDWDQRARGLGGTVSLPITTCAEENLLCYADDRYRGESILVHELAHTIYNLAIPEVDGSFTADLQAAYGAALSAGLWSGTYAATTVEEYFAEGVQSYFDTNLEASPPNGIHNHVDTRAELAAYDPVLYALVERIFAASPWRPSCP
jgi:hypothetical protein